MSVVICIYFFLIKRGMAKFAKPIAPNQNRFSHETIEYCGQKREYFIVLSFASSTEQGRKYSIATIIAEP
jgi:hypothetical protein